MKEFKINEYLTLKLEDGFTNLYVNDHYFMQCKYLLLNITYPNIEQYDEITSIDDAAKMLDATMEEFPNRYSISPEEVFWGHCSNLQAWEEYDYNPRLLHSNLSFPLLMELARCGDTVARRVYNDEILERLVSGDEELIDLFIRREYFVFNFDGDDIRMFMLELLRRGHLRALYQFVENNNLEYFSDTEINEMFTKQVLREISRLDMRISFPFLERLVHLKVPHSKEVIQEVIREGFQSGKNLVICELLRWNYIRFLEDQEAKPILQHLFEQDEEDYVILIKEKYTYLRDELKSFIETQIFG